MTGKAETLAREERWALPVAILTMLAVVLTVASIVVLANTITADTDAELLAEVDGERGGFLLAYALRGLGTALLAVPLLFLFRAASARSDNVRGQLIGIVIAGPVFLAAAAVASGFSVLEAASDFTNQVLAPGSEKAEEAADDLIADSSLRGFVAGLGFAGAIGYSVAMAYTAVHAMRVGLLTRFWGTLGMALGVVSILFFQFTLIWFIFVGMLIVGWVPGGRPPAWDAGVAVPWPAPGEEPADSAPTGVVDGEAEEIRDADDESNASPANPPRQRGERRKRKRRD